MTKGTKLFRIIVCVLLGLTALCAALFAVLFGLHIKNDVVGEEYGLSVVGIEVTRENAEDILGDGTVSYDAYNKVLTFHNAEIESDYTVVYSRIDLMIELVGENKFIMSGDFAPVIYVSNYIVSKDLAIFGEGSLSIEFEGASADAMAIHAKNLRIESKVNISMPDCSNVANGIYSESSLTLANGASVTLEHGAGKHSAAVKVRGNVNIEAGCSLNVSVRGGTTDTCKGFSVDGSLTVWDNAVLSVTVDDTAAQMSECINVAGLLSVGRNASVTATAKKAYAIECFGVMELNEGASVSAHSEGQTDDALCCGAIVNYGATLNGEVKALGGLYDKSVN